MTTHSVFLGNPCIPILAIFVYVSFVIKFINVFYHVHVNQNSQHQENNKKKLETRKEKSSWLVMMKLMSNDDEADK